MIEKRVNNRAPLRWMGTRSHPIPAVAKSFVDLLLEGDPAVRLGGKETGGKYRFIHHAFMWAVVGFWGWRQPRRRDDNPTKKTKMKTSCFIILRSTVVRDCFFFRSSPHGVCFFLYERSSPAPTQKVALRRGGSRTLGRYREPEYARARSEPRSECVRRPAFGLRRGVLRAPDGTVPSHEPGTNGVDCDEGRDGDVYVCAARRLERTSRQEDRRGIVVSGDGDERGGEGSGRLVELGGGGGVGGGGGGDFHFIRERDRNAERLAPAAEVYVGGGFAAAGSPGAIGNRSHHRPFSASGSGPGGSRPGSAAAARRQGVVHRPLTPPHLSALKKKKNPSVRLLFYYFILFYFILFFLIKGTSHH